MKNEKYLRMMLETSGGFLKVQVLFKFQWFMSIVLDI